MANPKKSASAQQIFWRQFRQNFFEMGAILPSSGALARAVSAYLAQKERPVQVLEVGAGTGAFTREIVSLLEPGDALDIVEINPDLMTHLQQRFQHEVAFQTREVTINFITSDIRQVAFNHAYDFIIFSLPLTNFSPPMVQEILDLMINRLKPGGVFSYVKYIFISRFKVLFGGSAARTQLTTNQEIIGKFAAQYQIQRRAVWLNIPPAWTYYWQKPRS